MKRICCVLAIMLSALSAHADGRPSGRVTFDVIASTGAGCTPGTVFVTVSPDNTEFTVGYASYTAQVGGGARPNDARKTCTVKLIAHIPQAFVYGIADATYRGFTSLAAGANGRFQGSFSFQGQAPTPTLARRFSGPFLDSWELTSDLAVIMLNPPPCGQHPTLVLNTDLQVGAENSDPATPPSFMTIDEADGFTVTTYRFFWQSCP